MEDSSTRSISCSWPGDKSGKKSGDKGTSMRMETGAGIGQRGERGGKMPEQEWRAQERSIGVSHCSFVA